MRFSKPCFAMIIAVLGLIGPARPAQGGEPVPNLLGSYSGVFVSATGVVEHFVARYIEQDNLRQFSGELVFGADGEQADVISFHGTIAASDKCTCVGSGDGKFVYQARWVAIGDGAGALIGQAALSLPDRNAKGTMIQFRAFSDQRRPDVRGEYAGTFRSHATNSEGDLVARISDGTSNTLSLTLALRSGRTQTEFVAAGDVNAEGRFVAVGVAPDGTVAVVNAIISGLEFDQIDGVLSIQSATGELLDVNSIIAILIG